MSVLGLMENTADIAQTTPDLSALPSTTAERMRGSWDAAQTDDRFWNVDNARAKRADKIIDDLHAMTGERLLNPYGIGNTPTADEARENVGQPMSVIYAKRLEKLRVATRNAKAGIEQLGGLPDDYLDVDSIDAKIASESGAARARDERMSGTGGGAGAFLGAMAGETLTPAGIVTTFIPVTGGIGGTIARATVGAFAKNVAKEALFQGGTQALAQGLQTIVDYQTRKQFGTEQTNAQIIDEIVSAGAGGALLGGAFRAAHLGILKLASRGVEIPPAVLDSARMMEEGDLYGNKNPLRINPGQLEVATDQATSAAALGRAASPDVDVPAAAAPVPAAAAKLGVTPEQYEGLGRVVGVNDVFTPAVPAPGKVASKSAFFIDPQGRIIDVSDIGHPEALARLNEMAGLGRDHEGGFYGGESPLVRIDTTTTAGTTSIGVNAYEGGVTAAQKRMIDQIERRAEGAKRRGESLYYQGEVSKDYGGAPVGELKDVKITDAGPPVPAAEAEKAVADARLQGAAAAEAAAPGEPVAREVPPATIADQMPDRAIERLANVFEEGNNQPIRLLDFNPEVVAALEQAGFARDGIMTARQFNDLLTARQGREAAIQQAAELQRLTKGLEERPNNPMLEPRPAPPEPKAQPTTAKLPGESAEDKALLQQAQQVLDSKTAAVVDPNLRRTMELAEIEESQARAAVACLAGAI